MSNDVYEKVALLPLAGAVTAARVAAPMVAGAVRAAAPVVANAARGLASGTWHALRSSAGFASTKNLTGAANLGRKVGTGVAGVQAVGGAAQLAGAAKDIIAPPPPTAVNSSSRPATLDSPGFKGGELHPLEARILKVAFGLGNATNIAGYLSLIGAEALPHEHPWHGRLEFGGLGLLAAPTLVDSALHPENRADNLQDLAGLALFANAANNRLRGHHTVPPVSTPEASALMPAEKTALLGEVLDLGAPSQYAYWQARNAPMTSDEAREHLQRGPSLVGFLQDGGIGKYFGQRNRAMETLLAPPGGAFPGHEAPTWAEVKGVREPIYKPASIVPTAAPHTGGRNSRFVEKGLGLAIAGTVAAGLASQGNDNKNSPGAPTGTQIR